MFLFCSELPKTDQLKFKVYLVLLFFVKNAKIKIYVSNNIKETFIERMKAPRKHRNTSIFRQGFVSDQCQHKRTIDVPRLDTSRYIAHMARSYQYLNHNYL